MSEPPIPAKAWAVFLRALRQDHLTQLQVDALRAVAATLHTAWAAGLEHEAEVAAGETDALRTRLDAVRRLHPQEYVTEEQGAEEPGDRCARCWTAWPCETYRAAEGSPR